MKTNPFLLWALAAITLHAASPSHAADMYLAVGPGGQRMFAKDGQTWENHIAWGEPKHDQNDLTCAVFFKGAAYAGGGFSMGRITATRDGKTWNEGVLPDSSPVFGLEVLNETLYAVTLRGQVYKTGDGESWSLVGKAEMPTKTHWIRFTKTGNGIILGCGDFGPALAFDPKTEEITVMQMAGQTVKNPGYRSVAFGNGVFVVCGQDGLLAYTKDGVTWRNNETHPERGDITSVAWVGNHFLAVARNHNTLVYQSTLVSKDGIEWKVQDSAKLPAWLVGAGEWLYSHGWPPSKVQCSRDGVKWEPMPNEKSYFVHAVAFGDLAGSGPPPKLPQQLGLSARGLEAADSQQFLKQHCFDCHDAETKKGGLDLTMLQFDPTSTKSLATWIKVYDRSASGEMPPKKKPRPEANALQQFLSTLGPAIAQAEQATLAAAGRSVARRLNRYEFENSLKDLLDLPTLGLRSMLPEDSMLHGYNRVGEALDISHVQVSRYLEAAELSLREAMATEVARPETTTQRYYTWQQRQFVKVVGPNLRLTHPILGYEVQYDLVARRPRNVPPSQYQRPNLAAESRPERREQEAVVKVMSTYEPNYIRWDQFTAPVAGRYRLKFSGYTIWMSPDFRTASRGRRSEPISIYAWTPRRQRWLAAFDFGPDSAECEVEVWLRQGETILPDATRLVRSRPPDFKNPLQEEDGMPGVAYKWMEATGPLLDVWPPAGHRLMFDDLPITPPRPVEVANDRNPPLGNVRVTPRDESADVPRLMRRFVERAYRHPVEPGEVEGFTAIVAGARQMGYEFTDAMIAGYAAVLASPGFLYQRTRPGVLDEPALAERLSYFLWNSPPDERLRQLAAAGRLKDAAVLRAEVDRMLGDARVDRFVEAFLDYWLDLRKMQDVSADANLYPEYALDDYLIESMAREPLHFFRDMLQHDRPVRNVVDSEYLIVNERLAELYDLPGIRGTEFRRVNLPPDNPRGGLMTQAAVLKVTANGTTTSPVLRGVWINERIRGIHTPPPPAGVPAVESDTRGSTTIREQLARHSNELACHLCHQQIDPPGFALESFDVMGAWRKRYRSLGTGELVKGVGNNGQEFKFKLAQMVDPSGQLPDGRTFTDIRELKRLLLQDEHQLAKNLAQQFIVYATGAPVRFADQPRVEALLSRAAPSAFGLRTLIHELVRDELFLKK